MDDLTQIFNTLKPLLQAYVPPLTAKVDDASHFDLWSVKDVVIFGRPRQGVYLGGLVIQKSFVGFYYMPIYARPELKTVLAPELIKLLKGKSCFHIKKLDEALLAQIRAALDTGYKFYQQNDWI
jgi:hypothetical protein